MQNLITFNFFIADQLLQSYAEVMTKILNTYPQEWRLTAQI